LIFWIFKILQ